MRSLIKFSLFIFIIVVLINTNFLFSSEMAGFNFLRTHVNARFAALAGAAVAIPGDLHSIYFNPAGLAFIDKRAVAATYLNHVLDFNSGFFGYAQYFKKVGTFGAGIHYINYGTFDETTNNGEKTGRTFGANSYTITASLSRNLFPDFLGGVSVKYIRSTIDQYTADAYAFDVGLLYCADRFMEDLDIGFAVFNLGKSISAFINRKENLPLKFAGGFSKKLTHLPLLFNINLYKFVDDDFQFAVGGEFTLAEGLYLRFGYDSVGRDQKVHSDYDKVAGFSLGFGVNWRIYQFDYSLSSIGELGSLNRITFSTKF